MADPVEPAGDELARARQILEYEKLKCEVDKLRRDAGPDSWIAKLSKNAIAIGAIVTVMATAFGIWDSIDKNIKERAHQRLADRQTRVENAIKQMDSPSALSKLFGVSVLGSYLSDGNSEIRRQVFLAISSLMATEQDAQIQTEVIGLVEGAPVQQSTFRKMRDAEADDWRFFQDLLVKQNRALVKKGDLANKRIFGFAVTKPLTPSPDEAAARGLASLISIIARKQVVAGHADYRGIYCVGCDFRDVVFPEHADFAGAILDNATFNRAALRSAVFDNAQLLGTSFISADLTKASFAVFSDSVIEAADRGLPGSTRYLEKAVAALDTVPVVRVYMPNFSCANLAEARFDHHALLLGARTATKRSFAWDPRYPPVWVGALTPAYLDRKARLPRGEFTSVYFVPTKFYQANLRGAHFEEVRYFSVNMKDDFAFPGYDGVTVTSYGEYALVQGTLSKDVFQANPGGNGGVDPIEELRQSLRATFYKSNFRDAKLPDDARQFLKKSPPTERDYSTTFRTRTAWYAYDPDLQCKPAAAK